MYIYMIDQELRVMHEIQSARVKFRLTVVEAALTQASLGVVSGPCDRETPWQADP